MSATKQFKVFSMDGASSREIEVPSHFSERVRPDLILRAYNAAMRNRMQPHGTDPMAGKRSSAKYMGLRKGWGHSYSYGQSRIPRLMLSGGRRVGEAKIVPQAVGGRRAHPPEAIHVPHEKINDKEKLKAIRSAIAATASGEWVKERGHNVTGVTQFPLIVESAFAGITKSKKAIDVLEKLGCGYDLARADVRTTRAGKGKMRGRPYKTKKSILVVVGSAGADVSRAVRNIPGVDVARVNQLNAKLLAPGGVPGRLTVWTEDAITQLKGLYNSG